MTTESVTSRPTLATRTTPARTLPRRVRQGVLILHIVSAGIWIGVDVIVAVLVLAGRFAGSTETRAAAGTALSTFLLWPMLISGIVCLTTGVVLGVGTKWGLLRSRWVAAKLVVTVLLCVAIVMALPPSLDLLSAEPATMPNDLFFPPAVSLVTLTFATTLAVVKPWGRLRRRAARPTR